MRFWLSREASVPIREQLSAQLILGILSRRFKPGSRLPSVRELARRLNIHANTVSAAYQDLATRGWVLRKAGAGMFVSDRAAAYEADTPEAFARDCVQQGLARGFALDVLQAAFASAWHRSGALNLLVVDPDVEIARVMAAEIGEAIGQPVAVSGLDSAILDFPENACVLGNEAHASSILPILQGRPFRGVRLKSMQDVVAGQSRPTKPIMVAVISRSESLHSWSATLLSALGFAPDCVLQRNPAHAHWQQGLPVCDIVAADVVSAGDVPRELNPVVFRIVTDDFLTEIVEFIHSNRL